MIAGDHSAPPLPAWAQRGYATDLMVPTTPPSPGCGHLLRADLMQRLVPELEVAPPGTVLKVWVAGEPGAEELALQLSEEG
ncbi:MAG: hypothetical protein H6702_05415 [Myxococcales bacterium]|nr:hypothetical protein [Myxococcales bacterium]